MKNMIIQQCILGPVFTNCYFLMNKETKELLIVDPADHPQQITAMVEKMEAKPVGILLTHGHYDHIMAVNEIKEQYGVQVYAHEDEQKVLEDPTLSLSIYQGGYVVHPDVLLKDGEVFTAAGFTIRAIHTPGHTRGCVCYYFEEESILVSGDTLFCESVGRSDLPTASPGDLMRSLHKLLEQIPEDVDVLPGHESTTTIGHEKRYNPFV